jgi:tetratricopeptide (TPR) repeat protein
VALAEGRDGAGVLHLGLGVSQALEEARASLEEGDVERAREAFRRALDEQPDDVSALVDLGHLCYAAGDVEEAVAHLKRALDQDPGNPDALRALVDAYRRLGRPEDALAAARALADSRLDNALAAIDVADLALELDRLDEAEAAFRRLRSFDDDPEHEVPYAHHGLIEIEIRRGRWRSALDLAVDATRLDRLGRTTDVLAFVVAQVFGESDRPTPERAEVEQALARSRTEHRRLHAGAIG